ncbi:MAG: DUF3782 domain-containing protein, partial [Bacteroidia bacterium]|nr:DUF3782 domain-containing protein [Bacteroidia bacterium]
MDTNTIQHLIQQLAQSQLETDRRMQETDRRMQETDRQIRELRKSVGEVSRSIGTFAEGLAYPSLERIMAEQFGATSIGPNVKAFKNGKTLELDVLGYANGDRNIAIIAEIKTRLRDAD